MGALLPVLILFLSVLLLVVLNSSSPSVDGRSNSGRKGNLARKSRKKYDAISYSSKVSDSQLDLNHRSFNLSDENSLNNPLMDKDLEIIARQSKIFSGSYPTVRDALTQKRLDKLGEIMDEQ
ncbi:MAG: hypothetical protein AAFN93_20710 [Bacteroidota bacterium]